LKRKGASVTARQMQPSTGPATGVCSTFSSASCEGEQGVGRGMVDKWFEVSEEVFGLNCQRHFSGIMEQMHQVTKSIT